MTAGHHPEGDETMGQTEAFLPRVTFTDASDARDTYFAVSAMCHAAGSDLGRAAKDESVTRTQLQLLLDKHDRLNDLATALFDEWQRLDNDADQSLSS